VRWVGVAVELRDQRWQAIEALLVAPACEQAHAERLAVEAAICSMDPEEG